jgi:hypothetical protein
MVLVSGGQNTACENLNNTKSLKPDGKYVEMIIDLYN